MSILQAFRLAFKSILANKMRSVLTMLGMIIGVGSVIIIVGLMEGVTNYIVDSFADMGTNMLTVSVTATGTRRVETDELFELAEEHSDVFEAVSPMVTGRYTLKNGTQSLSSTVTGVAESYESIARLKLESGRFLDYADMLTRQPVCVIGTYVRNELFEENAVVGSTVKIDGENFTVVGIISETADSEANSADDCVYIPYTKAARKSFTGTIGSYKFSTFGTEYVEEGEAVLDSFLYEKFKDEDLYSITSMTMLLDTINSMTDMLAAVLGGIAGISLLVAGIGIMNIMLVSVTERTQEIGIRKSLGARKRDIMFQFIIEAGSISALGGVIGIILGTALVYYIGQAVGVTAAPTLWAVTGAFTISAGIGLLFGYMPARKAAKLNPIDALRSD